MAFTLEKSEQYGRGRMIDERMLKKAVLNSIVFRKTRKKVTEALASNPSYILVLSFLPSGPSPYVLRACPCLPRALASFGRAAINIHNLPARTSAAQSCTNVPNLLHPLKLPIHSRSRAPRARNSSRSPLLPHNHMHAMICKPGIIRFITAFIEILQG